jgi:hypothetical protein
MKLSDAGRKMLWELAQHKYGTGEILRRKIPIADALVRRGLVGYVSTNGRESHAPRLVVTEAGRHEVERHWPISPLVLGSYEHQPRGWQGLDGKFLDERELAHA